MILPSLRQVLDAVPDVALISNYEEDSVVYGKKVEIAHYSNYNSLDVREANDELRSSAIFKI